MKRLVKVGQSKCFGPIDEIAVVAEAGEITGIVHSAGVVSDSLLADKTAQQWDDVLAEQSGDAIDDPRGRLPSAQVTACRVARS